MQLPWFQDYENVQTLVVGEDTGLNALSTMNLTGKLSISFEKYRPNAIAEAMEANLRDKRLTHLQLSFSREYYQEPRAVAEAELLLERLHPPSNLQVLYVSFWKGVRFPDWQLLNLVSLMIHTCVECEHLPSFRGLPRLETLEIDTCLNLELGDAEGNEWQYLNNLTRLKLDGIRTLTALPNGIFGLTMLQELELTCLVNLESLPESIGQLTQLNSLVIVLCPELEALPQSFTNLGHLQDLHISCRCRRLMESIWEDEVLIRFLEEIGCDYTLPEEYEDGPEEEDEEE